MVRLSELLKHIDCTGHENLGFLIYASMCRFFFDESKETESLLEGLSPDRILLNDDWEQRPIQIWIAAPNPPYTKYAYYPPEFLLGGKWDSSCTVFALCAILYRFWTCLIPYIDNEDDEYNDYEEHRAEDLHLAIERPYPLYLADFPNGFHAFIQKGLSLQKEQRYQSLKDSIKDFVHLPFEGTIFHLSDASPDDIDVCKKMTQLKSMSDAGDLKIISKQLTEE